MTVKRFALKLISLSIVAVILASTTLPVHAKEVDTTDTSISADLNDFNLEEETIPYVSANSIPLTLNKSSDKNKYALTDTDDDPEIEGLPEVDDVTGINPVGMSQGTKVGSTITAINMYWGQQSGRSRSYTPNASFTLQPGQMVVLSEQHTDYNCGDGYHYHGINVLTLNTTAKRDGVAVINRTTNTNHHAGQSIHQTWSNTFYNTTSSAQSWTLSCSANNWNCKMSDHVGCYIEASIYTINYSVTYNPNGGTGSAYSVTKAHNTNISVATCSFTKGDLTFMGWNTKADGTGTSYKAGATYSTNSDTTLYAQWKKTKPVTVNHYVANSDGYSLRESSSEHMVVTEDVDISALKKDYTDYNYEYGNLLYEVDSTWSAYDYDPSIDDTITNVDITTQSPQIVPIQKDGLYEVTVIGSCGAKGRAWSTRAGVLVEDHNYPKACSGYSYSGMVYLRAGTSLVLSPNSVSGEGGPHWGTTRQANEMQWDVAGGHGGNGSYIEVTDGNSSEVLISAKGGKGGDCPAHIFNTIFGLTPAQPGSIGGGTNSVATDDAIAAYGASWYGTPILTNSTMISDATTSYTTGSISVKYSSTPLIVDANGGTYNGVPTATLNVSSNSSIELDQPVWEGHEFLRWNLVSGSGSKIRGNSFTMGDTKTIIQAVWDQETREVRLSDDDVDITINLYYSARTRYVVNHYLMNSDGTFTLDESGGEEEPLFAIVTPATNTYENFISPPEQTIVCESDPTLNIVNYYYIRVTDVPVDIHVSKLWDDRDNWWEERPESIEVELKANGTTVTSATLSEATNWQHTFEAQPRYAADSSEITYTIEENLSGTNYTWRAVHDQVVADIDPTTGEPVMEDDPYSFTLTNTHVNNPHDIYIAKFGLEDTSLSNPLSGAEFEMLREGDDAPVYYSSNLGYSKLSLLDGTYTLTETSSPEGYLTLSDPVTLTIKNGQLIEDSSYLSVSTHRESTDTEDVPTLIIYNVHTAMLSNTGGNGIIRNLCVGIGFIIFGFIVFAFGIANDNSTKKYFL